MLFDISEIRLDISTFKVENKIVEFPGNDVTAVGVTDDGVAVSKGDESSEEGIANLIRKHQEQNERRWYVGIVSPRHEKKTADVLGNLGFDAFAAIHKQERMWSQRRKRNVDVVIIPAKIFIFCTNAERHKILNQHIGVLRFLINIAGPKDAYGIRPLAVIPAKQVENLRRLMDNYLDEIKYVECYFLEGDKVRITGGPLKGLEGIVSKDAEGASRLHLNIEGLGSASIEIDAKYTELI